MSRNLVKYPILREEIIGCLEMLANDLTKEEGIDDMRSTLLKLAAKIISKKIDNRSVYHLKNLKGLEEKDEPSRKVSANKT